MTTHLNTFAAGLLAVFTLTVPLEAKPGGEGNKGGGSEKGNKGGGGADKGNKGGGGDKDNKGGGNDKNKNDKGPDKKDNPGPQGKSEGGPGKSKGNGPDKDHGDFKIEQASRFKDDERGVIVAYFSRFKDSDGGLPPGLAKNLRRGKPLPPGWQDKVNSGYRIEDEYWDSFTPVSYDWFPGLRREPDYNLYYYNDRVVRVYEPRRTVVDVIVVR